jgi:hypothetical protein
MSWLPQLLLLFLEKVAEFEQKLLLKLLQSQLMGG